MKFLYLANERTAAERAGHALRGIAPNITLTWAQTLRAAERWVDGHRDAAAVIVEADVHGQGCASLLKHVRGRGLTMPIVVVAPKHLRPALAVLDAGANDYVVDRESLHADLPKIVTGALQRMRLAALASLQNTARLQSALDRERSTREALEARLAEAEERFATAEGARQDAEQRRESELAAAERRIADAQVVHHESLARAARVCSALEQRIVELETALRNAEEARATQAGASAEELAQRHAEFTARLKQATAWRDALAEKLSLAIAALDGEEQTRIAEAAAAADRLARREAEFDVALRESAAARATVEHTLADTVSAHQRAMERAAEDLARAAGRQEQLSEEIEREAAARAALEHDLAIAQVSLEDAERRHADELSAAAEHLGSVQAQYASALSENTAARAALEEELTETAAALDRTRQERTSDATAAAGREQELLARLNVESGMRTTLERDFTESRTKALSVRRRLLTATSVLRRRTREQRARLEAQLDRERAGAERLIGERDAEIRRISNEYSAERARLEGIVADRDAALQAETARHVAAQQAAEQLLAETQERLRLTLETSKGDIGRLQREIDSLGEQFETSRENAKALGREAERVPLLQRELAGAQEESRLRFERAPYGLMDCTRDGAIIRVNHSLVRLLGYPSADHLRRIDFATAVFECPGDLRWLLERSTSSRTTESVDAAWKTRDGRRLVVRLHALSAGDGTIEIAVEDLTSLRAVEQRLQQAQRMEAVGRVASEVAVTCDALLRDVTEGGQQWLAAFDSDAPIRHQGELLLGEVTRAASFLRQFAVYGNEQLSALDPVSVHRVLRDLEPVLKRVVGDDIELVISRTSVQAEVDVEVERVERILVNVAGYARERMPHGGRVKIDLSATVVDRKFIASHPNVRPGAHVLITVSEVRRTARLGLPIDRWTERPGADTKQEPSDRPGVDLGVLMELIGGCGGHLWMAAEPSGNMTLKIQLPTHVPEEVPESTAVAAHSRPLARWFRH